MYQYSVTQWVFFFYFYCFFGWCFESAYVSLKTGKLTNRGFMRGPFLPLYGSGAIMMLVVSMPFQDSMPLTYLAGCVGSTCLEYVTGVVMEKLFHVRYWDYSDQKFNFRGYICLSSTLAWGGLTILMTHVLHQYVEYVVFMIPTQLLNAVTFMLTAGIFADFSLSFKAALDMRDILLKLENAKLEWGHLQMRMDMLIALTSEEVEQRLAEYRKEVSRRRDQISAHRDELARAFAEYLGELGEHAEGLEPGRLKDKLMEKAASAQKEWQQRRTYLTEGMEKQLQSIFRANPSMRSNTHGEILEELQEKLSPDKKEKRDEKHQN